MEQMIEPKNDKRTAILDTAFTTFLRFGYRKTSMEEVAKAANVSRQTLYDRFPDKDTLFRECMRYSLELALADVERALEEAETNIDGALVRALDEWVGRYLEKYSTTSDISEFAPQLLGTMFADYGNSFEKKLAQAISRSSLNSKCKSARATSLELAQTLHACARGFKGRAKSRSEFVGQMKLAVRFISSKSSKEGSK